MDLQPRSTETCRSPRLNGKNGLLPGGDRHGTGKRCRAASQTSGNAQGQSTTALSPHRGQDRPLTTPDHLYRYCEEILERKARDFGVSRLGAEQRPVVELLLTGQLPLNAVRFDFKALEEQINCEFSAADCTGKISPTPGPHVEAGAGLVGQSWSDRCWSASMIRMRFRPKSEQWAAATWQSKSWHSATPIQPRLSMSWQV